MLDKDKLKRFLLSHFPNAHTAAGGKEVVIRCPFCGDSQKDMRDAHFYIGLQTQYDTDRYQVPPKYHCFLCNKGGTLTGELLLEMLNYNVDDESIIHDLNVLANKSKKSRSSKTKLFKKYSYTTIGCVQNSELDLEKLNYINNRLGLSLTIEQALKDKIVFSLLYFLYYNGINNVNVSDAELNAISNNFIGFLSLDNSFIIFRNCSGKKMELDSLKKRYKKYQITSDENDIDLFKYYCIPTRIDTLSMEPINIHVAEGPFDILSICYNLNHNNRDNQIYISAGGKGYANAVYAIIDILKLSPNIIIHIYPDNDVEDDKIKMYMYRFTDIGVPVYMHRNIHDGENDFGVKMSRINDRCIKI